MRYKFSLKYEVVVEIDTTSFDDALAQAQQYAVDHPGPNGEQPAITLSGETDE